MRSPVSSGGTPPEPPATSGSWVALFSGGKDSSWALTQAVTAGLDVERLLTVHPSAGSYMYHVPATKLAPLAAESIGISLVEVEASELDATNAEDASLQGDRELGPLRSALGDLDAHLPGGVGGLVAGAVESAYQTERLRGVAAGLDAALYAPLYGRDPLDIAHAMLETGFEIRIVAVAADGLDETWLGRRLDEGAFTELEHLNETHGVHILGEGGEFETIVTDGPHMSRRLAFDANREWDGTRGQLRIRNAWLE